MFYFFPLACLLGWNTFYEIMTRSYLYGWVCLDLFCFFGEFKIWSLFRGNAGMIGFGDKNKRKTKNLVRACYIVIIAAWSLWGHSKPRVLFKDFCQRIDAFFYILPWWLKKLPSVEEQSVNNLIDSRLGEGHLFVTLKSLHPTTWEGQSGPKHNKTGWSFSDPCGLVRSFHRIHFLAVLF